MNAPAYRDRMERIEAAVSDELELRRRLERDIADDARLDEDERAHAVGRVLFYLDDMHAKARAAERIARGEATLEPTP